MVAKILANKNCVRKRFTETISAVCTVCEGNLVRGLFPKPKSGQLKVKTSQNSFFPGQKLQTLKIESVTCKQL